MKQTNLYFTIVLAFISFVIIAQNTSSYFINREQIKYGDERMDLYLPQLKNKNVALLANQTSKINNVHILDTLLQRGINVTKIFSPEHGFRGNMGAGEHIENNIDKKTGIPIISLYGKHKKPTRNDLKNIDVLIFDIQDVGVRFYTYISTLGLAMEACAENSITMIVLDRPNPHDGYVDGPVLDLEFKSFIGMYPIPVVYGLTIGEIARMINGEKWLKNNIQCKLSIIRIDDYSHSMICPLDIAPSPNLPNMKSIILYPSLCFLEGTPISIGRGTDSPFQIFGSSEFEEGNIMFTPTSIPGVSKNPKDEKKLCHGYTLIDSVDIQIQRRKINLNWLITSFHLYEQKDDFFKPFFTLLAGTELLKNQIISGLGESEIRESWQADLKKYRQIRKKYLLYSDNR